MEQKRQKVWKPSTFRSFWSQIGALSEPETAFD